MLGRLLFRWRGAIGVLAFGVVFWLARPTVGSCLLGIPFLILGLAVRFWASGYIGIAGRVREIGGQEGGAPRGRIVTGPYRILRHPLYIGNFILVMGMLVALRPTAWMSAVVVLGFIVEYGLIVAAEEKDFRQKWSSGPVVKWSSGKSREAVDESFRLHRALVEWRTWVVTGAAFGLALLKAFFTR